MRTLPYDFFRCDPEPVAPMCHRCLRWKDLPEQTWGPRTAIMKCEPAGELCEFIEVEK